MQTMERFLELTDDGRPFEDEEVTVPCVRQSLLHLHEYATDREGLKLEGAWRLDTGVGRELRDVAGYVPAGGWRGLASLAAGCGVFEAGREEFRPAADREALADWSSRGATRRLLEAFTRRLVPPSTAAGLFILLGVHPAWGVHAAHRSHRRFDDASGVLVESSDGSPRRPELFPERVAELVDRVVFEAVAALIATLRKLERDCVYPLDALSKFVEAVCRRVRSRASARYGEMEDTGLPPFVDLDRRSTNWRVIDFTTSDLVDAFLVPAGAAHRFNDGTFCLFPDALSEVRVGPLVPDRQDEVLAELLADDSGCRVA